MKADGDAGLRTQPRLHRAPLVPVAAALMLGVVTGWYLSAPVGLWAFCGAAALLVAAGTFFRPHLRPLTVVTVVAAIVAMGAVRLHIAWRTLPADHVATYSADWRILATLRGAIVGSPQIVDDEPAAMGYRRPPRTVFTLEAQQLRTNAPDGADAWTPVSGLVRVTIRQPDERLAAAQQVELVGWMGRFRPPQNPGQRDWAADARQHHTHVWLTVPAVEGATVLEHCAKRVSL